MPAAVKGNFLVRAVVFLKGRTAAPRWPVGNVGPSPRRSNIVSAPRASYDAGRLVQVALFLSPSLDQATLKVFLGASTLRTREDYERSREEL